MGTTPTTEYLNQMGFPCYGNAFENDIEMGMTRERLLQFICARRDEIKCDYEWILVTEHFNTYKNCGYIFGNPNYKDGTIVSYETSESTYHSYWFHTTTIDDETVLIVGRHKLIKGK